VVLENVLSGPVKPMCVESFLMFGGKINYFIVEFFDPRVSNYQQKYDSIFKNINNSLNFDV
jgi:hypothetical protein